MLSEQRVASASRRGSATRAAILGGAEAQFAETGLAGSRLIDITERAGVTTGALYRYFEGKDGLLDDLFASYDRELLAVLDASRSVETAVAGWLDLARARPGATRAVEEMTLAGSRVAAIVELARNRWVGALASIINGDGTARERRCHAEIICGMIEQYLIVERMGWTAFRSSAHVASTIAHVVENGTRAR